MGVGAGLYMYVVVVQKFTFAVSSPDEFLCIAVIRLFSQTLQPFSSLFLRYYDNQKRIVSDIAIFVLKRDVKLQLTN